jgi:hypothetical protein
MVPNVEILRQFIKFLHFGTSKDAIGLPNSAYTETNPMNNVLMLGSASASARR